MPSSLPATPDLQHLKKQAKDLRKAFLAGDPQAVDQLRQHLPRLSSAPPNTGLSLHDAQHAVARRYGFAHWAALRDAVASSPAPAPTPSLAAVDERLRRHVDALGFGTVGAYRIWCHREGLPTHLDKSDDELRVERDRRRDTPAPPPLRRDHRPAEERKITQAYRGQTEGLWSGWVELFAGVDDPAERAALHELLVHCNRYAHKGGPPAPYLSRLARRHADWQQPVAAWIPRARQPKAQLEELTRHLLGVAELPDDLQRAVSPADHFARVGAHRPTVLSAADVAHFEERGYVRVPAACARDVALEIQDFMWAALERLHGFRRDAPATWRLDGWSPDQQPQQWTALRLNRGREEPIYRRVGSERLLAAVEELAGERARAGKQSWGAFTPVFPSRDPAPFDLGRRWSCYPDTNDGWTLGVHTLYSPVVAHGGAVLAVAGSQRLTRAHIESLPPAQRLEKLSALVDGFYQRHPYFAELVGKAADGGDRDRGGERVRHYMEESTVVDGVELRVVEWTGEPGDAYLYDRNLVLGRARNLMDMPVFTRG